MNKPTLEEIHSKIEEKLIFINEKLAPNMNNESKEVFDSLCACYEVIKTLKRN